MTILEWTEASGDENSGVDHLGMRVAGEQAYSNLIDFNTTVSWRPRYYSFFSWLTRHAFTRAGGGVSAEPSTIDRALYYKIIKKTEYAIAAATLLADRSAIRIAGSNKILQNIYEAEQQGRKSIALKGDHLQAPSGGLSIYGGPMRALGILTSSSGVDVPRLKGGRLADSFQESISQYEGAEAVCFGETEQDVDHLKEFGQFCSLNDISHLAQQNHVIADELQQLRDIIVDWENFGNGFGRSARRIYSIGLVLETRKLLADEPPALNRFRELILFGAVRKNNLVQPLSLPSGYTKVLNEWKSYQIHAYVTYALEAVLGNLLSSAFNLYDELGEKLTQKYLIESYLLDIADGFKVSSLNSLKQFKDWWEMPLKQMCELVEGIAEDERNALYAEPEYFASLEGNTRNVLTADLKLWAHDTIFLFLLALVRQVIFQRKNGSAFWTGSKEYFRLPPEALVNSLQEQLRNGATVKDYIRFVCQKYVLEQHANNALRKLVFQPEKDTAKFIRQGAAFIPLSRHVPGTSDPRYSTTIMYLQDLGYLTASAHAVPTDDGETLMQKIRNLSA